MSRTEPRSGRAYPSHHHCKPRNPHAHAGRGDGERGYVITGDSTYLQLYLGAAPYVGSQLELLRSLTRENPLQQTHLDSLAGLIQRRFAMLRERGAADPFVQLPGYTAVAGGLAPDWVSRSAGTGARGMNGDLTVQSVVGEGSKFILKLPRKLG